MDLLGQRLQLLGDRVDLLGKIGVPPQQVSLILGEFLSVFRTSFLVCLVGSGLRLLGDDDERAV
ncbi:MAG: hypothetical protein ACRDL9_04865 [Trebonia sp.]